MADHENNGSGAASDALDLPRVRAQILFYFSDSNYPSDKFMRGEAKKDPDSWIPLSLLLRFNRLKELAVNNENQIVSALEGLTEDDFAELSADKTKIRRRKELPESDAAIKRTIYLKGWKRGRFPGKEATEPKVVEPAFDEVVSLVQGHNPGVKVLSVRFRRFRENKEFLGSVFVELETESQQQSFLEKEPPEITVDDQKVKLSIESKAAWIARKAKEREDKISNKRKRKNESKETANNEKSDEKTPAGSNEEENKEKTKEEKGFEKGRILKFDNIEATANINAIKATLGEGCQYIEHDDGATNGYAKFSSAESCASAVAKIKAGEVKSGDQIVSGDVVSGDEEAAYWKRAADSQEARAKSKGRRGSGRGRGGKRGRR